MTTQEVSSTTAFVQEEKLRHGKAKLPSASTQLERTSVMSKLFWGLWGACPHQEHSFLQGLLVCLAMWRSSPLRCQAGTEPVMGRILTIVWEETLER